MKENVSQFSNDVIDALILLDNMRIKAGKSSTGYYRVERIEQAMDYLLNTPSKQGDPKTIVRDVLGSAGSKIRNRINVIKEAGTLAGVSSPLAIQQNIDDEESHMTLEVMDEISRTSLNGQTKEILLGLASGKEAADLAVVFESNVKAMRTRISKARTAYQKEVGLAV
ncbi:hypothetical protein AB9M92_25890 [Peribacillus frigoritolerans]|uniref:hypothetical protein n=1 Tax=Peribacillus frigoritolerans TaxID=450367 RepID=UPI003516CC9A